MRNIEDYTNEYCKEDFETYLIQYRRKKILEIINKYGMRKILEIGCGMDPLFKYIENYDDYVLVEPSKEFFQNALLENEVYVGGEKRLFINAFFENSEQVSGHCYDFIICSSLLHELETPELFLKQITAICNKDTVVHINVPNARSFHRVLAERMGLIEDVHQFSERNKVFQQHSVFEMNELVDLVQYLGFEVIERGGYFIKPFTHAQMMQMISNHIIDENTLDGLNQMYNDIPELSAEIYINVRLRFHD